MDRYPAADRSNASANVSAIFRVHSSANSSSFATTSPKRLSSPPAADSAAASSPLSLVAPASLRATQTQSPTFSAPFAAAVWDTVDIIE